MVRLLILCAVLVLPGCAVTLHGNQTTGGGQSNTTTGSSLQGSARAGNARVGLSSGTPPGANAVGGQVTFSRGASAVLLLGVAIAGAVDNVSDWLRTPAAAAARREPLAPGGISHTCSCYGWQPELTPDPPAQ